MELLFNFKYFQLIYFLFHIKMRPKNLSYFWDVFYFLLVNKFAFYLKYLSNKPLKAFPCLASSRAISCTVS